MRRHVSDRSLALLQRQDGPDPARAVAGGHYPPDTLEAGNNFSIAMPVAGFGSVSNLERQLGRPLIEGG